MRRPLWCGVLLALVIGTGCGGHPTSPGGEPPPAGEPPYVPLPLADQIVFTSDRDGNREIYVMHEDGRSPVNLTRTPGDESWPALSYDNRLLAFVVDSVPGNAVAIMSADGSGRIVADGPGAGAGAIFHSVGPWSPVTTQLAFGTVSIHTGGGPLVVVSADTMSRQKFTSAYYCAPSGISWAPDGLRIAVVWPACGYPIEAVDLSTGAGTLLTPSGPYVPFTYNSSLAWSPDGARIAFVRDTSHALTTRDLYLMDPDGAHLTRLAPGPASGGPVWSPDGTRLAYVVAGDVYVVNADGSGLTNLTSHGADDSNPTWSPDGLRVAFVSDRTGNHEIFVVGVEGGTPVNLTNNRADDLQPVWSHVPTAPH